MKHLIIRELLDSFISNYVPLQVRSAFASWMLDKTDAKEKEEALEDIWDEMALSKESFDYSDELPTAQSVLMDAEALENPVGMRRFRMYRALTFAFAAAACICLFVCGFMLTRQNTTTILVAAGSKTHYELPDGTSVWLNKGSKLSYFDNLKGRNRRLSLEGEAYFDVAKDASHPFVINTSDFDVKVLGTKFTLSAYSDSPTSVYLESGKVAVISPSFPTRTLLPGEALTYDSQTGQCCHGKEKISNHLSWTGDKLEFANAALEDIVVSLEHWYNVKILLNGDCGGERLSLTVRQEPLNEILNAIASISDIRYTINGNEITIY